MKIALFKFNIQQWKWLYAPSRSALGLALRTGVTSIIALYIALWMEMSSPFWAPLTVWMVALLTPEESNAKARWHLFGTILGTVVAVTSVAIFPQQAALFMICLAFWVGGCCFLASFLNNFRVHFMRVSAFTYALIAIDAIPDPNQIFDIAMSRATYIILAIILQKTATAICVGDQKTIQIQWLQTNLTHAISKTCFILAGFCQGDNTILEKNKNIFSIFYKLNQQSEFTDMAIAPHSHLGAHGRMILAIANNILLKTFCLQKLTLHHPVPNLPEKAAAFFSELPDLIKSHINVDNTLERIQNVKKNIHQQLIETAEKIFANQSSQPHQSEKLYTELAFIEDSLSHLEYMFVQFSQHTRSDNRNYFYYKIYTYTNIKKAFVSGLRVFIAIILASCIWEITAWSNGSLFVMYVAIICAITSITDRPEKSAKNYLTGAAYAITCTFFINFIFLPPVSDFEILTFIVFPFMFIGGLASCYPPIALTGFAFNFLFSVLISYNNQERINEITYFNLCLSLLAAIIFTWIICRLVFPINDEKEYFLTCKQMIASLRNLPKKYILPSSQQWTDKQISNLVYIINDTKSLPKENQDIYFYGAQAIILIGIQVIQIRLFLRQTQLPIELTNIIESILYKIQKNSSSINIQSINYEYKQLIQCISTINDTALLQKILPLFSAICIIRSQFYYYQKFIRLFLLSQKKYMRL